MPEPDGMHIYNTIKHGSLFKGQSITIYLHNGERGYCGDKMESITLEVTSDGSFVVEKSCGLEISNYGE